MAPDRSTSVTLIETTVAPPTCAELANKLHRLSIGKIEPVLPKIVPIRTTSVKEISNCSASCSHDSYKSKARFRPHFNKRTDTKDALLKTSEPIIRKKVAAIMTLKPNHSLTASPMRPRSKSIGSAMLLQGSFGSICRKIVNSRRRKSVSITSASSDKEPQTLITTHDATLSYNNRACGQQANSPEFPIQSGEVEELAEYFDHFVNVNIKMSATAALMYS